MAKLYFRYGTMNSGKTTSLIQVAYNYEETGEKAVVIKPKIDTKGESYVVSRIGAKREVDVLLLKDDDIFKIIDSGYPDCDVIIVDEAQFLTTKQVDQLVNIVAKLHIPVLAYGLRTDFQTVVFEGSNRLLQVADVLEEIKTKCFLCSKRANFNSRRMGDKFIKEGNQVLIDTDDEIEYVPLCTEHYVSTLGI